MAAELVHGLETIEVQKGPRAIQTVRTSVIGLVGTAPMGPIQKQTLCLSDTHAAKFGPQFPGFTIPQALDAILDHGVGTVLVVNVLDPDVHKTAVSNEVVILDGDSQYCEFPAMIGNPTVRNNNGSVTYLLDTDFTLDRANSRIFRKRGGAMPANAALKVSYTYADPTKVTPTDIIGGVNLAGKRTGMQAFLDSRTLFGYVPKLLIMPGYSPLVSVSTEMQILGDKLKAMALLDAPIGLSYDEALESRGPTGTTNFQTSSDRAILCYPHLKAFDPLAEIWDSGNTEWDNNGVAQRLEPTSQRLAGLIGRSDNLRGFWWSPSNQEYAGVTGVEVHLSEEERLALNAAGIVTYDAGYGTGIRAWGNRSAAWPTNTWPTNFIAVRRVADILHESIEQAVRQAFTDAPITDALIDAVLATVNAYIRVLIGRGALIEGSACTYDPTKNPPTELALGHLTFSLAFMPPPPAERITFESFIDIGLLTNLGNNNV